MSKRDDLVADLVGEIWWPTWWPTWWGNFGLVRILVADLVD